jgi:uncharacterized metal-binding protein YceD (DUF177 family)
MPPELSRPLILGHVPPAGRDLEIVASSAEAAALAARFGIPEVRRLQARLRLRPEQDGPVMVTGEILATVVQSCVVSHEPVLEQLVAAVALRLLPAGRPASDTPEDDVDEIETGGQVDLGELVAEEVALALDPYPRHPDASMPPEASDPEENPFAGLAALKGRQPPH